MSRLADVLIAIALLTLTLPVMILIAVAIKCDSPGPVLERELCVGRTHRRFQMLLFRTTVHSSEDETLAWMTRRVTRIGGVLHYTRMESLPQLFNVLLGDMSIIDLDGRSPSFLE